MLFHKGGIQHIISELTILEFLVKEYPSNAKTTAAYVLKIKDYTEGRSKESLNTIHGHSKNVLDHIRSDKENHFKKFLESIAGLIPLKESEKFRLKIRDTMRSQEQVQTQCASLELNLRELISCLMTIDTGISNSRMPPIEQMRAVDRYRQLALSAAKEIELRSTEAANKIKIVHKGLLEMRELIRRVDEEANKTHWVYSNINSWLR